VTPDLFPGRDQADRRGAPRRLRPAYKTEYIAPEKRKITQVVLGDKANRRRCRQSDPAGQDPGRCGQSRHGRQDSADRYRFSPLRINIPRGCASRSSPPPRTPSSARWQTLLGWHVIHVDDVQAGHDVPFDQVKNILIDQVKHDTAVDRLSEQIDKLGDKLVGGTPMENVAGGVNATPVKVGPIDAKNETATPEAKPDPTKPAPAKPKPCLGRPGVPAAAGRDEFLPGRQERRLFRRSSGRGHPPCPASACRRQDAGRGRAGPRTSSRPKS